jgi:putative ABC transport system substrate-binding protein
MTRRSVAVAVVAALAAVLLAPKWAGAQQTLLKIPRIGILSAADSNKTPIFDAFREGLRDLGYVEGRNLILEFRLAHGDFTLLPKLAAELVNLPADIIVADNGLDALARATQTIPIVAVMGDPMFFGLISSLSRPGGNVTGLSLMHQELSAKRLEMLHIAFPDISTVAILRNPSTPASAANFRATEEAARSIGSVAVVAVLAGSIEALVALRPAVFAGVGGAVVLGDAMFWNHRRDIVALVNTARLPAIYPEREYVEDGGLMAYGTNVPDIFRQMAGYIDRILKGASPADLPVQQPVKFDFVVNLNTARELGLTIPPAILARADEVIE